ncbi:PDZ domain-containing protein [Polaribacter batillariae]|uniref:PDZ domain-containing protein n=1 Tax=Polaribacter batillariae TaxID=2808900 RepID=UPI001FB12986|nr:PDZ domain-containing protein [Polaribacter batillariae]
MIGDFKIKEPTVSFLDTISTKNARKFKKRNGSIGGNVLKRFKIWLDYPNKQIMLKKNGSFKHGFNYNMSGLDVVYNGKQLVREESFKKITGSYSTEADEKNTISFVTNFSYKFKPSFKIKSVVDGSPGFRAGLKAEDIILTINGRPSHNYTLNDIINKFQERENKKIRITVNRKGAVLRFEFRLEKRV